jgi:hypothetical protein
LGSIHFWNHSYIWCTVKQLYYVTTNVAIRFGGKCEGQVPCSFLKAYSGIRHRALLIRNLGTRRRWVVNFTPQLFSPWRKRTQYLFNMGARWNPELVWRIQRTEKLLALSQIKCQTLQPIALSPYPLCYSGSYSVWRVCRIGDSNVVS